MNARLAAGAAQGIVTQPIGAEMGGSYCGPSRKVHSDITASALVLQNDVERLCIVAVDALGINSASVANIRARLSVEADLSPRSVLICATHTHAGPAAISLRHWGKVEEHYLRYLEDSIVGLVRLAKDQMREAQIGYGSAPIEGLSINRRIEGGAIDPTLSVVRVDQTDGRIASLIANFGCHPVTLHSHESAISADFPGYARQVVDRIEPSNPIVLYTNGGGADVNPATYVSRQTSTESARQMGTILGCEIVQIAEWATTVSDTPIASTTSTVEVPLAPLPPTREIERILAESSTKEEEYRADPVLAQHWNEMTDLEDRQRYCDMIRLRILRDWAADALAIIHAGTVQSSLEIEIQALRLGDAVLVGLPFEIFVQTVLDIKQASWSPHTIVISGANGLFGYLPPREVFAVPDDYTTTGLAHKAYGIYGYPPAAEEIVRSRVMELIDQLR